MGRFGQALKPPKPPQQLSKALAPHNPPLALPSYLPIGPTNCFYWALYLSMYLCIYVSIYLSIYLPTYLSIYLSIYLPFSLYLSLPLSTVGSAAPGRHLGASPFYYHIVHKTALRFKYANHQQDRITLHYKYANHCILVHECIYPVSKQGKGCRIRVNCCRSRMRPPSFPSLSWYKEAKGADTNHHKPMKEIERVYWKYQASELCQRLNYTQLILPRRANCTFFVARQSSIRIGSAQIQAYSDSLHKRSSISRNLCRRRCRRVTFLEGRYIGPFSRLVDELEWKQHFFPNAF